MRTPRITFAHQQTNRSLHCREWRDFRQAPRCRARTSHHHQNHPNNPPVHRRLSRVNQFICQLAPRWRWLGRAFVCWGMRTHAYADWMSSVWLADADAVANAHANNQLFHDTTLSLSPSLWRQDGGSMRCAFAVTASASRPMSLRNVISHLLDGNRILFGILWLAMCPRLGEIWMFCAWNYTSRQTA